MFDFSELVAAWNETLPLFSESVSNWFSNISINSVIVMIMMLFMLWGAIA